MNIQTSEVFQINEIQKLILTLVDDGELNACSKVSKLWQTLAISIIAKTFPKDLTILFGELKILNIPKIQISTECNSILKGVLSKNPFLNYPIVRGIRKQKIFVAMSFYSSECVNFRSKKKIDQFGKEILIFKCTPTSTWTTELTFPFDVERYTWRGKQMHGCDQKMISLITTLWTNSSKIVYFNKLSTSDSKNFVELLFAPRIIQNYNFDGLGL